MLIWLCLQASKPPCVAMFPGGVAPPSVRHSGVCVSDLSVCSEQQPCQNRATCVMEASGEYTCVCPEGFHGRNCQLKTGPCHQRR